VAAAAHLSVLSWRNALQFESLLLGSLSWWFILLLGCIRLRSGAETGAGQGAAEETAVVWGSGLCVRTSRWLGFAALIAVVHRYLQVNTCFRWCILLLFLASCFLSTCQQMLSCRLCSPALSTFSLLETLTLLRLCPAFRAQFVPIPSTENGKEELVIKDNEERFHMISNLVLSHVVGIIDIHICVCEYVYRIFLPYSVKAVA